MWKLAAEVGPLAYAVCAVAAVALVYLTRHLREIWFVFVVASAVAMALGGGRKQRGGLVVDIGGVGRLTFRPKQRP